MRLYKMELYKLLYRKIFRISLPAVLGILFAYFLLICVGEERTTIDGSLYTGFEAIRRDKEITEEFRGILTDEEARQIIEASSRAVILDYAEGWPAFLELLQLGMILGSALAAAVISPVFSEEQQSRMAALIFTSREGRGKDTFAKTAAAFTAAALIYIVITAFIFLIVGVVYGFGGGGCMSGMTLMQYGFYPASPVSVKSTASITFLMLGLDLLASGTPLFLVMTGILADWYDMLFIPVSIAACILVCTAFSGWNTWRRAEAKV